MSPTVFRAGDFQFFFSSFWSTGMSISTKGPLATDVRVDAARLTVVLNDGREVAVPLSWFPRLAGAGEDQLRNWTLIGPGVGIHWPDVDEHVSVESLLHPERTIPSREIREHATQHARR